MSENAVDRIIEQWHREMPELELDSMALFGRVHRVSQKVAAQLQHARGELGVGRGEFDVLASIRRSGDPFTLSPKEISSSLMLSSGGLTGRLDKLEAAGFIERLPDPSDRRGLKIRMTPEGRDAVEAAVRVGLEVQEESLSALTAKERKQLGELLRKLDASLADQPFG